MALGVGVAAGAAANRLVRPALSRPAFQRANARGRPLTTASGLAPLVVAAVVAAGPRNGAWRAAGIAATGLGLAGLADDLAGDRTGDVGTRGLAGHLGALGRGRLTTGAVKVIAGAVAGVAAAAALPDRTSRAGVLRDGAVVALAANLGNLLDRAPGRTMKVAGVATGALLVAGRLEPGPACLFGATLVTFPDDLRERSMLGDTGANLVGAAVGVALVGGLRPADRAAALVVLTGLTLASERWSFSAVIERSRPLRALDRLGRRS